MPAPDPNTRAHLEWLGFIQPNGLVVSAPALVKAGAILNRQDTEGQRRLVGCIRERVLERVAATSKSSLRVLGWGFSGMPCIPRLPRVRGLRPRLGLFVPRVCRHGGRSDSAGAGVPPPRLR